MVLTLTQLDIANNVIDILSPVEEITRTISEDKACISVIIPMVRVLRKTLEQSGEDRGVHSMKSAMLESLQKRFYDIEETDFLVLSTMLDPRYKDKFFSSTNSHESAKDLLEDVYKFQTCESDVQEPAPKRPATDNENTSALTEIDKYLFEPLIDLKKADPYNQKYLSAPPTSVPSEQLFSGAGAIYDDKRSCLKPEFVEDLLLIKYNFPTVGNCYQV
ncbi:zinc finger BED domain-containing protein 4-like [Dysidea avara]|uniref:zinc finger BED domain-containing protein 4-like n=1 Tax=Dysidea avara TaxID=196820 RepID=UPI00333203DF